MTSPKPAPPPKLETWQDVLNALLPIAPTLKEADIRDIILTVHKDPSVGPDILACYKAAALQTPPSVWDEVWDVVTTAANVAGIIQTLYGAGVLASGFL
jgi:hypothetical protein